MNAQWRIELFGGLRAQRGDKIIERFSTQKAGALLAYLAYYCQRAHPREVLVELLWQESEPKVGRHRLCQALYSLRRQLEPPGVSTGAVIVAKRFSVQLTPAAVTTDVAEFEAALKAAQQTDSPPEPTHHLLTAVELYRGELLPGYYDEWIEQERKRLEEEYLRALDRLVKYLAQAHDFDRALIYARRAVNADPLREEFHRALMRLYADAGQPAAALEQYHELERLLKEQLNAVPAAATRALARNINEQLAVSSEQLVMVGGGRSVRQKTETRRQKAEKKPTAVTSQQAVTPILQFPLTPSPSVGSLPPQLTRFFGRGKEITQVRTMLLNPDNRLVTLTGIGGSGKTRLAIEVARRLQEEFKGGVWFVPFADLSDPRLIVGAMLDALRLPRSPHVEPLEQLVVALAQQPTLLVLDNMEHLLSTDFGSGLSGLRDSGNVSHPFNPLQESADSPHPSSLILTLLQRVPTLKLLVTSRQRLDLGGEQEFPVLPLPTPTQEYSRNDSTSQTREHANTRTPEHLMTFASVQLFVDRAQAVRPDFQVTKRNASAVAALCQCLEGIPLALELAAARAQVLSPSQVLAQLKRRFDFLVSRRRDIPERHRTLRAAIDWSYRLLSSELQRFFARLSVFRGGWTLEAAENVATLERSNVATLDFLAHLRACSLIVAEEGDSEMRFGMLETLCEYAAEQLTPEEQSRLVGRHAHYYLRLAEENEMNLEGAEQEAWLQRWDVEHDNVRAALAWGMEHEVETTLRLAGALEQFWVVRGHAHEGLRWLTDALRDFGFQISDFGLNDSPIPQSVIRNPQLAAVRAAALNKAGTLALNKGDYALTRSLHEESLALWRELGDQRGVAHSLGSLGYVAYLQGETAQARSLHEQSLALRRELGDRQGIAQTLSSLGWVAFREGNFALARSLYEESLALFRALGHKGAMAHALSALARVARHEQDFVLAHSLYEESLSLCREAGDKIHVADCLISLGVLNHEQGDLARAHALLEESLALSRELGRMWGIASALHHLGMVASQRGDWARARPLHKESLALFRELGNPRHVADSLHQLALVAIQQQDWAAARAFLAEGLSLCQEVGYQSGIARRLEGFAALAAAQEQCERAVSLSGAASALREGVGSPLPPLDRQKQDEYLLTLRQTLGEPAFTAAFEGGRALACEQAVAYALETA